ncbi:hypothetical protein SGLAM104S_10655 [Streptomyces glaucescens]
MPVPAMFFWVAWTKRASSAISPKFQPSPYRMIFLPSTPSFSTVSASRALRTARMLALGWWPMRSKRNPSTLYCLAQVTTESTTSLPIMAFSVAVFAQQVLLATEPSARSRW